MYRIQRSRGYGDTTLIANFAQHRVAANLTMIMMTLAGIWAIRSMPSQLDPPANFPIVFVEVQWIGASAEDIDTAMKLGTNQPMGPLALADFIGLDTCLAIMEVLHDGIGDAKYRPCPLLRRYVDAGRLGRKSGHGFHGYEERK